MKQNFKPLFVLLPTLVGGFILFLAAVVLALFQEPTNPDRPLEVSPLPIDCEAWAEANEVVLPQCIGSWALDGAGNCHWICEQT